MINDEKYTSLIKYLNKLDGLAVAFSGGVDSTFLLVAAREALGDKLIAISVKSPYIPEWEIKEAKDLAASYNIRHKIIELEIPEIVRENPPDRCYLCKGIIFQKIIEESNKYGFNNVADGTNIDDTGDYRPGLRALEELSVISPLKENNIGKQEIRNFSRLLGLPTWEKPAYACLLTRLPYGSLVTEEELYRIELAEKFIIDMGFKAVRVRSHGEIARIEIPREKICELIDEVISDKISIKLKEIGYKYITVDIQGYVMGGFNEEIIKK